MLAILAALLISASPNGQIAYVSEGPGGDRCVVVLDIASKTVTRVGPGTMDGAPQWTNDGRWLAFDAQTESGRSIFVVQEDGSEGRFLRHSRSENRDPVWSPDGLKIAFSAGADRQIVVYDVASNRERVWGGGRGGLMTPTWLSRDLVVSLLAGEEAGRLVVSSIFAEASDESVGLLVIGLTKTEGVLSSDLFLVTATETVPIPERVLPSKGAYAEWRPVAARRHHAFAFESDDGGDREIFLYSRKGTWDLTNHRAADWNPVWAPNNDWLAFESFRGGWRGVYRVHRDTARVYPVAVTAHASNWWPSWSPNGQWIVFVSDRRGKPSLFVTDVSGRNTTQLTQDDFADGAPAWRPRR